MGRPGTVAASVDPLCYTSPVEANVPRVIGLDVGDRTIGVAVSDEEGRIAFPGDTIRRQAEGHRKDVAALVRLVRSAGAERVVVGLPLSLDGTLGPQAEKVQAFAEVLRRSIDVPVEYQDERLSTNEAERVLVAAGRRREQRKQTVDSMAASLLLQTYLDRKGPAQA